MLEFQRQLMSSFTTTGASRVFMVPPLTNLLSCPPEPQVFGAPCFTNNSPCHPACPGSIGERVPGEHALRNEGSRNLTRNADRTNTDTEKSDENRSEIRDPRSEFPYPRFRVPSSKPRVFMAPPLTKKILGAIFGAALCTAGCNSPSAKATVAPTPTTGPPPFVPPGTDPWKLVWSDSKTAYPAVLWNGRLGLRIGKLGNSVGDDGQQLPLFSVQNYEKAGPERLRPTTSPLTISFSDGSGAPSIKDWSQSLDMSNGKIETSYTEHSDANDLRIVTTSVIDPDFDAIGQEWFVTPTKDATLSFNLDFHVADASQKGSEIVWGPFRNKAFVNYSSIPPLPEFKNLRLRNITTLHVAIKGGQTFALRSGLVLASDHIIATNSSVANSNGILGGHVRYFDGQNSTYEQISQASTKARAGANQPDIEIDGPIEDQQAVRSFIYNLRCAVSPYSNMSISPMGMSGDTYAGHVFWDADIWVFPALALIDPKRAEAIPNYRVTRIAAARTNYTNWVALGEPNAEMGSTEKPALKYVPKTGAMKFPWESSTSGKETTIGPSRYEDHVSGSVAFSIGLASALDLINPNVEQIVNKGVAAFYADRAGDAVSKGAGQDFEFQIKGLMSPDESHIGDNDLYTNLLAQWCMYGGTWVRPHYAGVGPRKMYLPKDDKSFLTYDNDAIKGYKQAAAVLAIYPLQYPPAEQQAKVMMDRFADKVIKNGPAMTDSVHAIIWARIGESDKAYDAWRHGWMDFVQPPFLIFSEKRGQNRTYFTTGAGGELQSVIYGFLGFRIDSKPEEGASWSLKLKGDRWLSIKPNLPKAWKRVTFRNFHVLGKSYTLTATHQSVQVTQGD